MARRVNRRNFLRGAGAGAAAVALSSGEIAEAGEDTAVSALTVDRLTVEYATNPLGTDVDKPRLAWILRADRNGATQTAYQVQVVTDPGRFEDRRPHWDSGPVRSSRTLGIHYDGPALKPRTRYHWRVRVWDGDNRPSAWSTPAWWETGQLGRPWAADWIGATAPPPPPGADPASWIGGPGWTLSTAPLGSRWFRATLDLPDEVRKATLVATADDNLTVHLHGREVLSAMASGNSWAAAHLVDVTEVARTAGSALTLAAEAANRGGPAGLLLRLIVELADGRTVELLTGPGWRATDTAHPGWTSPGYDDSAWPVATVLARYGEGPWGRNVTVPATQQPAPLLRKDFRLDRPVLRARLYISGLAYYEAQLNGGRIGDQVLDPGFTGYDKTVLYAVHDITGQLRQGDNQLDVTLGRGFYGLTTINVWDWHLAKWHGEPRLLAQLEIEHPGGARTTIGTDGTWRITDSHTRVNSLYSGETHDARHTPGPWTAARTLPAPTGALRAQPNEPIRITETIRPASITELRPGVHVADMGRTMAGWTQITVRAPAGTRISLLHGEKLNPDGSVQSVNEHVKDLRQQRDEYITAGTGAETWEPRFSYKGFRYVEITGPRPEQVLGRLVHSDVPEVSEFRCSEPMFEQLDRMMRRTIVNNLHALPTDTPKYEKNGWTGDAQVGAPSMAYAFGMQRFFAKWVGDLADAQDAAGQVPVIVPNGGRWGYRQLAPTPEWTTVFPFLAREMHRWYGDDRLAAEHWPALTGYLDWEINRMRDGLALTALGDFLPPDAPWGVAPEDNRLTATAYLHRALIGVAELGEMLGHKDIAARYRSVADAARDTLNRTFLRGGHYNSDRDQGYRQTSNAIPLAFGLVPPESVQSVVDSLAADIRRRGNHLNTGCLGTSVLLPVLTAHGHADLAHAIAVQRTEPSWGYWIDQGADTMWEMWHKDSRSRNHYFQGTVTQWLYENVGGLRPLSNGYERFLIRPDARTGVDWARTGISTVRGQAGVSWAKTPTGLTLTATVPVGATAEIHLPLGETTAPPGATRLRATPRHAEYEVGSGTWTFTTKT
ncbi:alpha-L-rhamnosidase [Crossiella cryophila]|uniref:alpha-L-rhamnosidase n=1 Tax=Crossiella cryophila TaxID=43355 RepID=A0A7W7CKI4_9PSEU|nr:alpha-L-rhamnosidase [Crossiella cryophila]MBB4681481.1 alpha-L-rhamnosidase [Crossiella cryophila]